MSKASTCFLLLFALGCARPTLEGAQIREVPPGFGFDGNCQAFGGLRFGREMLRQRCWFTRGDPSSSVVITEIKGLVSQTDLDRDILAEAERRKSWIRFEPVETLTVARRPAWGWYQEASFQGKVSGLSYVAVVPWTSSTYVVEFSGQRPQDRDRVLAKRVVSSFAVVHRGDFSAVKAAVALGLTALAVLVWRRLQRAAAQVPPKASGPLTLAERQRASPSTGSTGSEGPTSSSASAASTSKPPLPRSSKR